MKTKIVFASATALGLLIATGAFADNNHATVDQSGGTNTANIDQSQGDANWFGVPHPPTGATYGHVKQDGNDNTINSTQIGRANTVVNWFGGPTSNVYQKGDNNDIEIYQRNNDHNYGGNALQGVDQLSNNGSQVTNQLILHQDNGSGGWTTNRVGLVTQHNAASIINNANDANVVNILQSGGQTDDPPGGYYTYRPNVVVSTTQTNGWGNNQDIDQVGLSNYIGPVLQDGHYNRLVIDMNGEQNAVSNASQTNTSNSGNFASVTLHGNNNGTGSGGSISGKAPWYASTVSLDSFTGYAADVSIGQAVIYQNGNGNSLTYSATNASNNLFGLRQEGSGNFINGIVTSDNNQAAVYQHGDGNVVDFTQENGGSNNLGISMDGDDNHINALQQGAGSNRIWVDITGDDNNNYGVSAAIEGDALDAKLFAQADLHSNLTQGMLIQNGLDNDINLVVSTDKNVFAAYQHGDHNTIEGTVNTGNANQAVVAQVGDNNLAVFTQSGMSNNIGITQ